MLRKYTLFQTMLTSRTAAKHLADLDCLKKLSKPLLSIIADYSHPKSNAHDYNEERDLNSIEEYKKIPENDCYRSSPYHFIDLIGWGHIQAVQFILESKSIKPQTVLVMYGETYQTTPLIHALKCKRFEVALFLIDDYAKEIKETINSPFKDDIDLKTEGTALSFAMEACHLRKGR